MDGGVNFGTADLDDLNLRMRYELDIGANTDTDSPAHQICLDSVFELRVSDSFCNL